MLADGTKVIFQVSLAILALAAEELLELDFGGINEYFKAMQEDAGHKLMSDVEKIIDKAYTIKVDDKRINEIMKKLPKERTHDRPNPLMAIRERPTHNSRIK